MNDIIIKAKSMKIISKKVLNHWAMIILAWIIMFYIYFAVVWGINDFLSEGVMKNYINSWYIHFELLFGGVLFGFFFNLIDVITDYTIIRRKSFGYIIFIKTFLYLFMVILVFSIVFGTFVVLEIGPLKNPQNLNIMLTKQFIFSYMAYFLFIVLFLNFIVQINRKLGPGNLINLITGKYHKPRDECRIFLFLDLKDSTTIAENLGHNTYSKLLRNCYHDLTDIVIQYHADIYQYVGDEVVLSWKVKEDSQPLNCIGMYFAYEKKLNERQKFYLQKYNTKPEFKGGMDMGVVTVAEIGDIKREIAYHGDVLNTASRIQDQCKLLDKNLLISENVEEKLAKLNGFKKELIGDVNLRGKVNALKIYSLEQA